MQRDVLWPARCIEVNGSTESLATDGWWDHHSAYAFHNSCQGQRGMFQATSHVDFGKSGERNWQCPGAILALIYLICHPLPSFAIIWYILALSDIWWLHAIASIISWNLPWSPLISLDLPCFLEHREGTYGSVQRPSIAAPDSRWAWDTPEDSPKLLSFFDFKLSTWHKRGTTLQVSKRFQKAITVITVTSDCTLATNKMNVSLLLNILHSASLCVYIYIIYIELLYWYNRGYVGYDAGHQWL